MLLYKDIYRILEIDTLLSSVNVFSNRDSRQLSAQGFKVVWCRLTLINIDS